eukprot:13917502-Alexandrium_andersonii.AAC.1
MPRRDGRKHSGSGATTIAVEDACAAAKLWLRPKWRLLLLLLLLLLLHNAAREVLLTSAAVFGCGSRKTGFQ